MANFAQVEINFTDIPTIGTSVNIGLTSDSISQLNILENCRADRLSFGQYEQGLTVFESASNYRSAVLADFVTLHPNLDVSPVLLNQTGTEATVFLTWNEYENAVFTDNSDDPNVTTTITSELAPAPEFSFVSYIAQPPQVENVCTYQRVSITVENAVYPITIDYGSGLQKIANNSGELFVEVPRYLPGQITLTDDASGPDSFTPSNVASYFVSDVNVLESLSGATITIISGLNHSGTSLNLQYSLDGINYQTSNVFSGILEGNYTAYLRDSFNCVKTQAFTVEGLETPRPEPSFVIEKANPLRFVDSEAPFIRNVENTLFNEQNIPNLNKYYFRQPFELGTVVRTQIKTPYRNLTARIIDDCTEEVIQTITPDLKVQNIGQKDKRDCYVTGDINSGNFLVFFPKGDIYEPGTTNVINSYTSRGQLPQFAQIGMFVELSGNPDFPTGSIKVNDFVYNENVGFWCLELNAAVTNQLWYNDVASGICESTYNAEEYDVYEFGFTENKGQYRVEIEATDDSSNYDDLLFISEPIYFDNFNDVVTIQYTSEDNQSGINYQTGIIFTLKIPGRLFTYSPAGDDETFEDDYGNKLIQKAVYIAQLQLETGMIPAWLAEKIVIASTHENLTIQGIELTMAERPETEPKSDNNNPLYILTGVYQVNNRVIRDERTGIVSSSRAVIGADGGAVLGI